ncbi:hypothetical protein CHS0354_009729 [Potamilus streckersoni]|uniref:Mitochondria-eating protein C-terminal domain-containing protein n=1 Tax=Potamilus streckersoni TaxID=2493646 RepID=A0AAE0S032_9BIVA|nr:hypothetical protein CHS0354_009729 [Potamilus streckersoni]
MINIERNLSRTKGVPLRRHKQKLKDENIDWKERWTNTEKEKAQLKSAYDSEVLKSHIEQAQIDDLERERKELLYRLSKLAGDTLTHNNSNIANLGDLYRPSILSDIYCELYDNEWTDAFQELTDHGLAEKDAVEMLLNILLMCFHKCREITWERYQTLKHIMSNIDIVHIPRNAKNLSQV